MSISSVPGGCMRCRPRCRRPGPRAGSSRRGSEPGRPWRGSGRVAAVLPEHRRASPLRHHIEDLRVLVPFFLAKLNQHPGWSALPRRCRVCSGRAGRVIPGSCGRYSDGSIQPNDLPPECWTVSRRLLSPLESMECDAIVQSLLDYKGNKVKAAESLGMSRATIYRKIHEYGIVTPG